MLASAAMRSRVAPFRLPGGLAGLLLVVLALVGQLAAGAMAPAEPGVDAQLSELAAAMGQCRTPQPGEDTRHHRAPECAPAVASAELAVPGFVVAPSPVLPAPVASGVVRRVAAVSARGPPSRRVRAGYPRGPPVVA